MTETREMTDKEQEAFNAKIRTFADPEYSSSACQAEDSISTCEREKRMLNTKTYLGKISSVTFGKGGYQDVQFGLSLTFEGNGWGTSWFQGDWDTERSPHAKWGEEERTKRFGDLIHFMRGLFKKAKINELNQLKGIPVEATFVNNTLSEWRVLEEVL